MKKQTYVNAEKKKRVREFLINQFMFNSVVGLPGPDINEYIQYMRTKGCTKLDLYENDRDVMIRQLVKLSENEESIRFIYGDIIKARPNRKKTLYDLDFCASVKFLQDHIRKFKDNFIMTFHLRIGLEKTLKIFFGVRGEEIIERKQVEDPLPHIEFLTTEGRYLFITYHDTTTMCCFAKIT